MPRRYPLPKRPEAIAQSMRFHPGNQVRVYAEELEKYGPMRDPFMFPAKVLRWDFLPGSTILTGRLVVETTVVVHYQKSATRNGTRVYQTAEGKSREITVWPWDLDG